MDVEDCGLCVCVCDVLRSRMREVQQYDEIKSDHTPRLPAPSVVLRLPYSNLFAQ